MAIIGTILVLSFIGFCVYWRIKKDNQAQKVASEANECITTKGRFSPIALIVRKRDPSLLDAFTIEEHRDVLVGYTPDKYIYQGATSGGITMGEITKIDGGYSLSSGNRTGKYYLIYKYAHYEKAYVGDSSWNPAAFDAISLSNEDYLNAKNDPILKKFVPDEKEQKRISDRFHGTLTEHQAKTVLNCPLMTFEEAVYLRKWLTNSV